VLSRPGGARRDADRAHRRAGHAQRGADLTLEVGLGLQSDKHPREYVQLAQRAENAGVDVISVFHDLLYQPAIAPLILVAMATEHVRLGPAALNPYTLHPVEIAGQVAALDAVSGGRAFLGLAHGSWLDRLGLEQSRPLATIRETIEIVGRLLAGDRSGFEGERFRLAPGAGLEYEPLRPRVPLMLGTWRPRLAALAGEVADEVKIGGCANPDMVRLMREWIGREEVGVVVGAITVVDPDGDRARELARAKVAMYVDVVRGLDPTLEPGGEPALEKFALAGTPAEVVAHVEELAAAGLHRVEFGDPIGLDLLLTEVVPALRST
jgi:5,10-methylenetetrahydromethanopterin reductase